MLEQFRVKFNDKLRHFLLKMSLLYKEKKYNACEKLLSDLVEGDNKSSLARFYLIQVLLQQGKVNEAIEQFKFLEEFKEYKLGIVRFTILM